MSIVINQLKKRALWCGRIQRVVQKAVDIDIDHLHIFHIWSRWILYILDRTPKENLKIPYILEDNRDRYSSAFVRV